jgi:ABC-type antimicrobial peptide transport system permease subunit
MESVMNHMSFAEDSLGYFPINLDAFILQDFKLLEISVTFLQLVFNLVMLLLCAISVLLVYSLLMFSVESKSFDLGVMRMVGLSKTNVIWLIVYQGFMFVVPSIIFGFTVSLALLQVAKHFMENNLHIDFEAIPPLFSVI